MPTHLSAWALFWFWSIFNFWVNYIDMWTAKEIARFVIVMWVIGFPVFRKKGNFLVHLNVYFYQKFVRRGWGLNAFWEYYDTNSPKWIIFQLLTLLNTFWNPVIFINTFMFLELIICQYFWKDFTMVICTKSEI